jgi:CubicO group peptidase (beta-lactamase class C family)
MSFRMKTDANSRRSEGHVAPGFEAVRNELDTYLLSDPTFSAQLAIYHRDELVVDLVGGADLEADSVTGVFSASKGLGAMVLATLVQDGRLSLDKKVVEYWPEFAPYKESVTVRDLLSHKAGLIGVEGGFSLEEILDSSKGAARLAAQRPQWYPGTAFGYHSLTVGIMMEELVRRITGDTLQNLYENVIRKPLDVDFYLGLPTSQDGRYRQVLGFVPNAEQTVELDKKPMVVDGLAALALDTFGKPFNPPWHPNYENVRAAGPTAVGGAGSAWGLAKAYAAALGFLGGSFMNSDTREAFSQQQSWGHDRTLDVAMCFGVVFQKPQPRMEFGSYRAFGHDGAGGALGFADPAYDMGFGYIPMPMQFPGGSKYPGGTNPRPLRLSQIARECVGRLD